MSEPPLPRKSSLLLPDFTSPVTKTGARRQRWRHNLASWLTVPLRAACGRRAPEESFAILMYHRVCPLPAGRFPPTWNVTPRRFARQLEWLLRHGYQARSINDLVQARLADEPIGGKVFAVTFDDVFGNVYTHAFPILQELRVPATMFLATEYLDDPNPFPFDNWISDKQELVPPDTWLPITRQQCHRMVDTGLIDLGAHSHSHADFRNDPVAFETDLTRCLDVLRRDFGVEQPPFAYPFGDPALGFSAPELGEVVKRCGCSCGLQIGNSVASAADDLFHLPRFDVAPGDTGVSLDGKMSGWSEALRAAVRYRRGIAQ